jgi:hypothetical protein
MRYLKPYNESKVFDPAEAIEAIKIELEDCKVFHADVEKFNRDGFGESNTRIYVDVIADFSDNEEVMQMFNHMCEKIYMENIGETPSYGMYGVVPVSSDIISKGWRQFSGNDKGILYSKLINVIKGVMDKIIRKWEWRSCQVKPYDGVSEYLAEFDNEQLVTLSYTDGELKFAVKIAVNI